MTEQPPAYEAPPQVAVPPVVTVQTGQTAVAAPSQPPPGNWKGITRTGIIQVVLGALTTILGITVLFTKVSYRPYQSSVGSPIWCGLLFYTVAGILGIVSSKKQNQCAVVAYMVMSILACLSSLGVVSDSATELAIYSYSYCADSYFCRSPGFVALHSFLTSMAVIEFVVSIVGASFACGVVCCAPRTHTHSVVHYQVHPHVFAAGQPHESVVYPYPVLEQKSGPPPQQVAVPPQGQFQPPPQGYQYAPQSQAQPHV